MTDHIEWIRAKNVEAIMQRIGHNPVLYEFLYTRFQQVIQCDHDMADGLIQ
jgi:hypothetical protein